jgi:hypothetical protein
MNYQWGDLMFMSTYPVPWFDLLNRTYEHHDSSPRTGHHLTPCSYTDPLYRFGTLQFNDDKFILLLDEFVIVGSH